MKSKVLKGLAISTVLLLAVPTAVSAETVSLAYKGGSLHLRKGPGTENKSVAILHDGDHIDVLEAGDVWSKVELDNGKVGYIKNLYIDNGDDDYAAGTTYVGTHFTVYTTGNVNFRAGASTGTKSMGVLAKGTKLTVLGENGSFYLVENAKGTQGYVSKSYASTKKDGSGKSAEQQVATKTITGGTVNMRAGGGVSYKIVKVLTKGTKVTVKKTGNYWTKVEYKGTTGWVRNTYLK